MAARYWRGGSGTWSSSNTTNWSTTNGGSGGASVPTSVDDVFVTSLSGSPTITMGSVGLLCKSITTTGATCTFSGGSSLSITVSGSITLSTTTTWSFAGPVTINATGTLTTNNIATFASSILINAPGGTVTLGSAFTSTYSVQLAFIDVQAGTFNTANFNITFSGSGYFNSTGVSTRAITLGTSTITITSSVPTSVYIWNIGLTGLTFSGASSTISITASGVSNLGFNGGGRTYGTMSFTNNISSTVTIAGTNTFTSLTLRCQSGILGFLITANQTVSGTLTCINGGSSATQRVLIYSDTVGTARTISAGTTSLTDVDFRDITAAGTATWSGTRVGNAGGNTGITFTAARTLFWNNVTSGTAYNATNVWATTVGGTVLPNNYALPQDTITFSNTGTTNGMSIGAPTGGGGLIATFYQYSPAGITGSSLTNTITFPSTNFNTCVFTTATAVTLTSPTFFSRATQTLTGVSYSGTITLNSINSSTFQLGSAFTTSGVGITLAVGTFNLNGFNYTNSTSGAFSNTGGSITLGASTMSVWTFTMSGTGGRTLSWGTGNITCTATSGTIFNNTSTGITFSGTPKVILSNNTASASVSCALGSTYSYDTVTLSGTAATQTFSFTSAATVTTLNTTKTNAFTIRLSAGNTFTVTNFSITGTVGNVVTLNSTSTGTQATLAKAGGGTVTLNYMSIRDSNASPASTWTALNSTDVSNNTNWNFGGGFGANSNYFLLF